MLYVETGIARRVDKSMALMAWCAIVTGTTGDYETAVLIGGRRGGRRRRARWQRQDARDRIEAECVAFDLAVKACMKFG